MQTRRGEIQAGLLVSYLIGIAVSAWPTGLGRLRLASGTTNQRNRVSIPGADTANQAVHLSRVGKLVAVTTTVEHCEGIYRRGREMIGGMQAHAACTGVHCYTSASCNHGRLGSSITKGAKQIHISPCVFTSTDWNESIGSDCSTA
jgi:hypothetical protein